MTVEHGNNTVLNLTISRPDGSEEVDVSLLNTENRYVQYVKKASRMLVIQLSYGIELPAKLYLNAHGRPKPKRVVTQIREAYKSEYLAAIQALRGQADRKIIIFEDKEGSFAGFQVGEGRKKFEY